MSNAQLVPGTKVIWRNAGADIPATITTYLGDMSGEAYYSILQFDGFASPGGVPASQLIIDALEFSLDDVAELDPNPTPAPSVSSLLTDRDTFIAHLHRGGAHRFTQDLTAGATGDKTVTRWSRTDEPLKVPPATGKENLYYSVNPVTERVTDNDRAKYAGKSDSYIERYVASKNSTIAALNCFYADVDGKDFTTPTQVDIDANFHTLRNDPTKAKSTDKALRNEALGRAKAAAYKLDPAKYLAMAIAHVAQLSPAPSVIVASGGGFQCFWLFDKPFMLITDADRKRAIDLQKRWVNFVGGDPGVCDIRRVLRLPGSINHKKAYAPNYPLVSFVKADFSLLYTIDALEACLPVVVVPEATQTAQKAHRRPQEATTDASPLAALDLPALQAKGDSLIAVFNANVRIRDILRDFGYSDHSDRMSRPGEPESKGVVIDDASNRSQHWSSNDPLYDPHWQTPFSVFCRLQHNGNFAAARQALIHAIIPDMRMWARTTSFEEYIPDAFKTLNQYGKLVYMTDATDTKSFDSMLDIYAKTGTFGATVSKRIGGRNAGVGANTFVRSLQRMTNFFEVTVNADHTYYVRLKWENVVLSRWTTYYQLKNRLLLGGPSAQNDKNTPEINEYSPRKADDPFLTGLSRFVRVRCRDIGNTLDIDWQEAKEQYTFAGLGETCLRLIDAHIRCGDMTAQEAAQETGKKVSAVRNGYKKLVQHGMIGAEREGPRGPKVYSLAPDVWAKVDEIAPNLRTYGLSAQREDKRLEASQIWAQRGIDEAIEANDIEKVQRLEHRFSKLAKQRIPQLGRLLPDLPAKHIERLAYEVYDYKRSPAAAEAVRTYRSAMTAEHRNEVRVIRELADSFSDIDTPQEEVFKHIMQFGTFDESLVKAVLQSPKQMKNYETLDQVRRRMEHETIFAGLHMTPVTPVTPSYTQNTLGGAA